MINPVPARIKEARAKNCNNNINDFISGYTLSIGDKLGS